MNTSELLDEIKDRAKDRNLSNPLLLNKINNEYDQSNLQITNLNEDYFFTENAAYAVTTSPGPYTLPVDFAKFRALIAPSGEFLDQVSPANEDQPYGWYFSGTQLSGSSPVKRLTLNATSARETGNYKLRYVAYPTHLDLTTNTVPLWPEVFHEILILGALKRHFSVQDLYDKFPDLKAELLDLKATLLSQIGGLNLGAAREVVMQDGDID